MPQPGCGAAIDDPDDRGRKESPMYPLSAVSPIEREFPHTPGRQPWDWVALALGAASLCHIGGITPPAPFPEVEKR